MCLRDAGPPVESGLLSRGTERSRSVHPRVKLASRAARTLDWTARAKRPDASLMSPAMSPPSPFEVSTPSPSKPASSFASTRVTPPMVADVASDLSSIAAPSGIANSIFQSTAPKFVR